jgi:hypothetical protein
MGVSRVMRSAVHRSRSPLALYRCTTANARHPAIARTAACGNDAMVEGVEAEHTYRSSGDAAAAVRAFIDGR